MIIVSPRSRPGGRTTSVIAAGALSAVALRDYATVAFAAASGKQAWAALHNGPVGREDYPAAVVADPAGNRVYVTGTSTGDGTYVDYATIAYRS